LTFPTPYRNVRPDVSYVGDQACAGCHPGQSASYRNHPMGRSAAPTTEASSVERYGAASHNPFAALGHEFRIERRDGHVFHSAARKVESGAVLTKIEAPAEFAIGSGVRGRSY